MPVRRSLGLRLKQEGWSLASGRVRFGVERTSRQASVGQEQVGAERHEEEDLEEASTADEEFWATTLLVEPLGVEAIHQARQGVVLVRERFFVAAPTVALKHKELFLLSARVRVSP